MTLSHDSAAAPVREAHAYPDDAPSSVVSSDVHRALREDAIANEAGGSAQVPLALFWEALARGVCRVVDTFFTSSRCYVVTAGVAAHAEPALSGRRLLILERILSGVAQKNVALDMGLAPSTVALNARLGLRNVGVLCKPSRVHPLLMLAAKAAHERDLSLLGAMSIVFPKGVSLRALSVPRPDARLLETLPPAASDVIRSLVEGDCYEHIARQRGTSPRTVANQIATVFNRMRVSGRNELVHRLFDESPIKLPSVPPPFPLTSDWRPFETAVAS